MLLHCQVQVSGPDSKGLKSRYSAFHTTRNGRTTLSASGILVLPAQDDPAGTPNSPPTAVVLAPVSCLYPFIQSGSRHRLASASADDLIPSVDISILLNLDSSSPQLTRAPAVLTSVCQLPAVQAATAELLLSVASGSGGDWKLGWCLAEQQPQAAATPDMLAHVAVLEVQLDPALLDRWAAGQQAQAAQGSSSSFTRSAATSSSGSSMGSSSSARLPSGCAGLFQPVTVTGSPFGCLAEQQFFGALVTGCISLLLPPAAGPPQAAPAAAVPLFLVDGRCMPGMEGGPIHCRSCGALLGVLGLPLSNCSSQAELLLGIHTHHLAAALAAAAAASAANSRLPQLQGVARLLQAHSSCSCRQPQGCRNSSAGSGSGGGWQDGAASSSSSGSGSSQLSHRVVSASCSSPASSTSSSGLQRRAAAAHDVLWQQPNKLVLEQHPQQQQQQQQQQQWRADGSSGSHGTTATAAAAVRRLQVHLKHAAPAAAGSAGTLAVPAAADGSGRHCLTGEQHLGASCAQGSTPATAAGAAMRQPTATTHCISQAVGTCSSSTGSSSGGCQPGLPPSATAGVVMVRAGGSWGSGVLITHSGLVLTVAHLFRKSKPAAAAAASAAAAGGGGGLESWPNTAAPQQQSRLQGASDAAAGRQHAGSFSSSRGPGSSSSSSFLAAQQQASGSSSTRRQGQPRLYPLPPQHLSSPTGIAGDVRIRLTLAPPASPDGCSSSSSNSSSNSSSSNSSSTVWVPAQVLYCFSSYLDLAVLQVLPGALRGFSPGQLQPLQLVPRGSDVTPGDEAYVVGHGLFGPRMGLNPAVTAGCVGRVVALPVSSSSSRARDDGPLLQQQHASHRPHQHHQEQQQDQQQQQGWRASMVISTAAVHSGASGGALLDAAGRLVGLVTSNARHVRGQTLPHLNFCISAAELRPVWDWAQQQQEEAVQEQQSQGQLPGRLLSVQDAAQQLRRFDVERVAGTRLWALQPYMPVAAAGLVAPVASSL